MRTLAGFLTYSETGRLKSVVAGLPFDCWLGADTGAGAARCALQFGLPAELERAIEKLAEEQP